MYIYIIYIYTYIYIDIAQTAVKWMVSRFWHPVEIDGSCGSAAPLRLPFDDGSIVVHHLGWHQALGGVPWKRGWAKNGFGGFHKWVPQNGWFLMENPIKMLDLGVPPFKEIYNWHTIFGYIWEFQDLFSTFERLQRRRIFNQQSCGVQQGQDD